MIQSMEKITFFLLSVLFCLSDAQENVTEKISGTTTVSSLIQNNSTITRFQNVSFVKNNVTEEIPGTTTVSSLVQNNSTITRSENVSFVKNNASDDMQLRMVTPCTTPNGDVAFCMPIMKCPVLINQLTNKNATKFLQQSTCGPNNENKSNPNVCCGKYSNFRQKSILPKNCGYQNVTIRGRIFGGKEAKLGEFPWLARLYHKDDNGKKVFGCSGFLITSKFILTAAHCLESNNNDYLGPVSEIHLGEHDTETEIDCTPNNKTCGERLQKIGIKKLFVHPSYHMNSKHHHHDIGLIHLKKGAKLTSYVSPVCVTEHLGFEPFEYWLSGWGQTETEMLSHIKMKVSVPPYPHSNCTKKYDSLNVKIIEKQLCAGGKKNKDSCTGDSGGPLMVADRNHWFAVGVVSYGLGCGRQGWPAVYTNITSYTDWIKKTISQSQQNDKKKNTTDETTLVKQ